MHAWLLFRSKGKKLSPFTLLHALAGRAAKLFTVAMHAGHAEKQYTSILYRIY